MRIIATDAIFDPPTEAYAELVEDAGGEISFESFETEAEVGRGCRDADVVLTAKAPVSRAAIEEMGDVDLIVRTGMGYDNVDVVAATEHGIPVATVPFCAEEVANHAVALMLSAAHDVVHCDREMREANGWGERPPLRQIHGGTFGVFGFGRIGRAVVRKARGVEMDVLACDPYVSGDVFDAFEVERVTFEELLVRSDCVSVHSQLTAETRHRFSTEEFRTMKDEAVLVNTARGPIVDVAALVDAVEAGEIRAAGLDVFETEPPADSPAFRTGRIVCSPHHAGVTPESKAALHEMLLEKLALVLGGHHPEDVVNPEVFKHEDGLLSPEFASD